MVQEARGIIEDKGGTPPEAYILLNRVRMGTHLASELREAAASLALPVLKTQTRQLTAYMEAATQRNTVWDLVPRSNAYEEMENLCIEAGITLREFINIKVGEKSEELVHG